MGNIKGVVKRSPFFQYKKILDVFKARYLRDDKASRWNLYINEVRRLKVIYEKGNSCAEKIAQIDDLFKNTNIDIKLKYGFLYFVDEIVIPYSENLMVDNAPYNYRYVVENPLGVGVGEEPDNPVAASNAQISDVIFGYIERIIAEIKKNGDINDPQMIWVMESLSRIHESAAVDLKDALQRILFFNQILNQTGHKLNGFGRLDKVLDRFPVNEKNRSIIANFLKVLHEYYNFKSEAMLGDTGQIIILGGLEDDGTYFCNEYTYIFLDELKKLSLPDPKILLRVAKNMPDYLLQLAISGIEAGTGSPLLSNDEIVIPSLIAFGYDKNDAYNYGVSACWEPLSIGNSFEQNNLYDIEFGRIVSETILSNDFLKCADFKDVIQLYKNNLKAHLHELCILMDNLKWAIDPIVTLAMPCCLESAKDIAFGGAKYNNFGLLSVGLSSAIDSLLNIKEFVFEKKEYNLHEISTAIKLNYFEYKEMKNGFSKKENCFGKYTKKSVELTNEIIDFVDAQLDNYTNRFGGSVKFGLSSPGYVNKGKNAGATADGRCSGVPFSTHISCSVPNSLTDIILFAGHLHYTGKRSNGNVVDIMIQPNLLTHDKFVNYIRASIDIGFFQIQFNIIDYKMLCDAKAHPEKYHDLIVRVWGFSAYFKDIPEMYQDTLIERARINEFGG